MQFSFVAILAILAILAVGTAAGPVPHVLRNETCNIKTCLFDLAGTVTACAPAIAAEGVNPLADFSCLVAALKELDDIPDSCIACVAQYVTDSNLNTANSTNAGNAGNDTNAAVMDIGTFGSSALYEMPRSDTLETWHPSFKCRLVPHFDELQHTSICRGLKCASCTSIVWQSKCKVIQPQDKELGPKDKEVISDLPPQISVMRSLPRKRDRIKIPLNF
ncbi:hypothetical protein DFH08DRAFT_815184 [Mycena albidolilacea]|uniref:Fungal calcium binding protein domain-containing protein n=1 Tax=Mycena albidolilacea TaxID=1033008 RepID=A0AAD6ZMT1_9AGAR|nr:hypothetical protein DFH08DRAFT_815184 [Mycena albidolilacea]